MKSSFEYGIQSKLEQIGKSGCYFLSILKAFDMLDYILPSYNYFIEQGWMDKECFVKDPTKIVWYLSGGYDYTVSKTSTFDPKADIKIAYYYSPKTSLHHFVLIDNDKKVVFDPLGDSNTVKNGYTESYRLFYRKRT